MAIMTCLDLENSITVQKIVCTLDGGGETVRGSAAYELLLKLASADETANYSSVKFSLINLTPDSWSSFFTTGPGS